MNNSVLKMTVAALFSKGLDYLWFVLKHYKINFGWLQLLYTEQEKSNQIAKAEKNLRENGFKLKGTKFQNKIVKVWEPPKKIK